MERGLAIIEMNEAETRSVFIDQDVIECARLNALTKKHIAKAEAERRKANRNRRKAELAKARRTAYTVDSILFILLRMITVVAIGWAGTVGMIHPVICVPVAMFCICTSCVRLGTWIGRGEKK